MNFFYRCLGVLMCYGLLTSGHFVTLAGDWPMWRYDAGRGAWSADALPDGLQLQWVRELPKAAPAWPETQQKLQFDAVAQAVVAGRRIFVPSSRYDSVTAYSTRDGKELWRFYSNGPVRFAPVVDQGKVFFVSDDGYLYALNAADGKLRWRVKGGPEQRRLILGNHRLVSSWPARGGVVLHQGKLYFGSSIWPFMGIFIRAVDPESGKVLWTNSGDGTNYINQPHGGAVSFSGLVPQGHLAATGGKLVIPGGRSVPGVYDAVTGKQLNFAFAEGKKEGGSHVGAVGELLFAQDRAFTIANGLAIGGGAPAVFNHKKMLAADPKSLLIRSTQVEIIEEKKTDRRGKKIVEVKANYQTLQQSKLAKPISGTWLMAAGDRFYTGGEGRIKAYEEGQGKPVWEVSLEGDVRALLAADDRLFAVTSDGKLYCYGKEDSGANATQALKLENKPAVAKVEDSWSQKVADIFKHQGAGEGYALVLGVGSGRLIDEVLRQSKLQVVVMEKDGAKVERLRRQKQAEGIYGSRLSVIEGELSQGGLPAYLCNLIVSENSKSVLSMKAGKDLAHLFQALRPYGGVLALPLAEDAHLALLGQVKGNPDFAKAKVKRSRGMSFVIRAGSLPGSGDWTHQYGDVEQTLVSRDKRVKAPFGVLWFGGASHESILPRHGHGPSPQVAGGRLFVEGPDLLRAVDVYTGRVMWEKKIPGFGEYFNRTDHFAGAGETGSNYVSMPDRIYALNGKVILELDSQDGKELRKYQLAPEQGEKESPHWGSIRVSGDYLVATAKPLALETEDKKKAGVLNTGQGSGSRLLVVYDRRTGKELWRREAELNFRHNNIALSQDRIFCIDRLTEMKEKLLTRRGMKFGGKPVLYALNLKTGEVIWKEEKEVFGTFLNYSTQYDALLQAGAGGRDRAKDGLTKGMMVLRGKDGEILWHDKKVEYSGPCLLWRDKIITNGTGGYSIELLSGKKTGWNYSRTYGCNTAIGSENLLTFRSGAAGFFDLAGDSGTGNLGGFKSSCTANLIVADGLLNAPDYTRTCVCSYQNQTSLALIHMPEAEFWTYGGTINEKRLGINFGAPGDRRSADGTLFLDFPVVGGKSPELDIEVVGEQVAYVREHASLLQGTAKATAWLGASVLQGAEKIVIGTKGKGVGAKVRLYFASPEERAETGGQVFDVSLQGERVLKDFDLGKETAGKRVIVKEFVVDLKKKGLLEIGLKAKKGKSTLAAVEVLWE